MKNSDKVFGEFNLCMNFYLQHKNLYFEILLFALNTRIRELILPRIRFILSLSIKSWHICLSEFPNFWKISIIFSTFKSRKGKIQAWKKRNFRNFVRFFKILFCKLDIFSHGSHEIWSTIYSFPMPHIECSGLTHTIFDDTCDMAHIIWVIFERTGG